MRSEVEKTVVERELSADQDRLATDKQRFIQE